MPPDTQKVFYKKKLSGDLKKLDKFFISEGPFESFKWTEDPSEAFFKRPYNFLWTEDIENILQGLQCSVSICNISL